MKMKNLLIPAFIAVTAMASANELNLSNFLTNTTFRGDTRVRYQNTSQNITNREDSDKLDARLRLNLNTKINDNFSVGTRLVTGDREIGKGGSNFNADRLFLNYKFESHNFSFGRMGSPLFVLSGRFFDTTVEGITYSTKIQDTQIRAGFLVQAKGDGSDSEADPAKPATRKDTIADARNTIYVQGIHTLNLGDNKLDLEASLLMQQKEKGSPAKNDSASDLTVFTLGAQYTMDLGADAPLEMARLRAQYLQSDANKENTGYSAAVLFGSKSISNKGDWQGEFLYGLREANVSMLDTGKNNTEFVKIGAKTYVAPRTNLEVNYEMTESAKGKKTTDNNVLSLILNHSF